MSAIQQSLTCGCNVDYQGQRCSLHTQAHAIATRINSETAELKEVREQVDALLRPLRDWQRKAILNGLTYYTRWDRT